MITESKVNILLVDDRQPNLLALRSLLQNSDYNLVTATSGDEALRATLKQDFALILLDVIMPDIDGFETAALLRGRERTKFTPIIFITAASAGEAQMTKGYSLGAVDYIFKPIVPEILRAKVQVFVELFRRAERIKIQTAELTLAQEGLRRELSDNLETQKALRESEEKYRLVFNGAREAILIFDKRTHQVLDANDAATLVYSCSRQQLLKMTAEELFADPSSPNGAQLHLRAAPQRRPVNVPQVARDGRVFPAEFVCWGFGLRGRDLVIAIVRDVTERIKAEENERLLARETMQRNFVATVSHELRTPIAAIKGFAETLRLGGLDDAKNRLRFIKIIEKHADKLGWLVEDILTLNAMESGKLKPQCETIPVREFTKRFIDSISPIAARRDVTITIDIDKDLEVTADPHHLTRILQNLIDNAIKYNVKGGNVRVEAALESKLVRVSVHDTGIGIPAHDVPLIFQQFHRSETAKALAIGGSGLGLYIIKSIVESNGGQIWAESTPGKGSTFHFTLPHAPAAAIAPARSQQPGAILAARGQ
jgi:PAS domain S-box-containing protein